MMKKILAFILTVILTSFMGAAAFGCKAPENEIGNGGKTPEPETPQEVYEMTTAEKMAFTSNSVSASDGLGRFFGAVDTVNPEKQVGLFYFLWIGQGTNVDYDISKLTLDKIKNDTSTVNKFHYWSEPLYGYYDSGDPWVFRKHLELFAMAGIDYLFFDTTNGYYYADALESLLPVALQMQQQGYPIPKLAFYCNAESKDTVTAIYNTFYNPNTANGQKYADLWYRWEDTANANADGKPWIAARVNGGNGQDFANCSAQIQSFFYLKDSQWPNEGRDYDNGMPWMSWAGASENYKQYNHNGIMSVSVAQHTSGAFSDAVLENNRTLGQGRGWTPNAKVNDANKVDSGANFDWQWQNVFERNDEVNNVFITGWNEWIAQKQQQGHGRSSCFFVDLYDKEFSRDIEMMKGGYGDNFYLQMIQNIRKFKAMPSASKTFLNKTIELSDDASQWKGTAEYLDLIADTAKRNYKSVQSSALTNLKNETGRNDIVSVRVTDDNDFLYFRIECADKITPYDEASKNWMNLLIEVDGLTGEAWNNYHYVVNRTIQNGLPKIERLTADGGATVVSGTQSYIKSKLMVLKLAKADLDITSERFTIRFKVADNVTDYTDIMNYYVDGDCAPIGRLSYTYNK